MLHVLSSSTKYLYMPLWIVKIKTNSEDIGTLSMRAVFCKQSRHIVAHLRCIQFGVWNVYSNSRSFLSIYIRRLKSYTSLLTYPPQPKPSSTICWMSTILSNCINLSCFCLIKAFIRLFTGMSNLRTQVLMCCFSWTSCQSPCWVVSIWQRSVLMQEVSVVRRCIVDWFLHALEKEWPGSNVMPLKRRFHTWRRFVAFVNDNNFVTLLNVVTVVCFINLYLSAPP